MSQFKGSLGSQVNLLSLCPFRFYHASTTMSGDGWFHLCVFSNFIMINLDVYWKSIRRFSCICCIKAHWKVYMRDEMNMRPRAELKISNWTLKEHQRAPSESWNEGIKERKSNIRVRCERKNLITLYLETFNSHETS